VERRCPGGAFGRINNLRAAHGFRGEDYVCTAKYLPTPNDLRARSLCRAVSGTRSPDNMCSEDNMCSQDNMRSQGKVRSEDNVCSEKTHVPTSDSFPRDHLCACHYLCTGRRSEVGYGSEMILTPG
jgi:hypothetical protein